MLKGRDDDAKPTLINQKLTALFLKHRLYIGRSSRYINGHLGAFGDPF